VTVRAGGTTGTAASGEVGAIAVLTPVGAAGGAGFSASDRSTVAAAPPDVRAAAVRVRRAERAVEAGEGCCSAWSTESSTA
jgi:hypothetical protein